MNTKLISIFILLTAGISTQSMAQESKTIKSALNEATVFFQGAELIHSATATLIKGENELIIEGLSPSIDKNSLKIKATNGAIVSSFEYSVDFLSTRKVTNPLTKRIQDSIDICKEKLTQLETNIKITTEMQTLLQKGIDKNVSGSEKGLGIDELIKTMDYYRAKSIEIETAQTKKLKQKDDLNNTLQRLETQLQQETLKNNKTSGILKLLLSSPIATTSNLTVSYYTSSANWSPYYDINVAATDKPINITLKSKVWQTTGLDWEKVKLTLSTATPSNGKVAPLFNTWFLQQTIKNRNMINDLSSIMPGVALQNSYSYADQSEAKVMIRGASTISNNATPLYIVDGVEMNAEKFAQISPEYIKSIDVLKDASATSIYGSRGANGVIIVNLKNSIDDYITQSDNDLNMFFNIDIPYTIPGNGKEQNIELANKQTLAEYKYYCAPKLDTETYLLAEIPDWQKLNLLTGKANVTYDGTYVGETMIDASSTSEKLALTLGTDKRVIVKREKMQDFSTTRFLGNDVKQVFTYKLTVKNNQNKAIKMVLKDQYPISTQKSIEVELLTKDSTRWTINKEEVGVITWEEELTPGQNKEYRLSYSVKYPKGVNLNL